ncbi:RNA polymerase II-associated protein 1 [[Candida] anglica]|uniref:RNA polymerase II-associated protein 1 n=1 Tax=[Candida] anglica TaxID=148631 RepID=A0ABP0EI31_9ASCO
MSKSSSKPVRQDYIAKVRYVNTLPPPPLNPKYLKDNTTEPVSTKEESEQLLSSLFRKQNFLSYIETVDDEYGLNLNLINNHGCLNNGDESSIFSLAAKREFELHPKDKVLLRDAGIGKISKSEPGVSFLRRTEYISEKQSTPKVINEPVAPLLKKKEGHDAESQLAAVEKTFDEAQDSLDNFSKLKHPRKRNAKAVAAWPLLPDTSMLDTKFLSIKFTGSASVTRELELFKRQQGAKYNENFQKKSLETAIFKPITTADGEWMSLYQVKDVEKVEQLQDRLNSTEREQPVNLLDEDENTSEYKFKHIKNYDMHFERFTKPYQELTIKFIPNEKETGSKKRKAAYYYPVNGRIELKKHRASQNTEINRFLKENTADIINFKLREPNTDEMKQMDNLRSTFDPMEYEGDDEEIEEDVEGQKEESNDD